MKKFIHNLLIFMTCIVFHVMQGNEEIKAPLLPQPMYSTLSPIRWKDSDTVQGVYNRNLEISSDTFSMPNGSTRIDSKVNNVLVTLCGSVELDGSPITYTDLHFESNTNYQTVVKVDHLLTFAGATNEHPFIIEKSNKDGTVSWEITCQLSFVPFSE